MAHEDKNGRELVVDDLVFHKDERIRRVYDLQMLDLVSVVDGDGCKDWVPAKECEWKGHVDDDIYG